MDILAALFVEQFQERKGPGGSARFDLGGVHFSTVAAGFPATLEPHLVVFVHCPADGRGMGALEVRFLRDGEQVARNVQVLQVEPGKFNRSLVRPELTWETEGTIEAHCRIDQGPVIVVPLTVREEAS